MDSRQNTGWHVATRYDARKKNDITFESCVIMNQRGLIMLWIRSIAHHALPQSWMVLLAMNRSPRHVGKSVLLRVEYDRVPLWVYHTAVERKKKHRIDYTAKLWDGAHSILKCTILNRNWRITDDWTQENMSNRLFMFGDILNLEPSARWIW